MSNLKKYSVAGTAWMIGTMFSPLAQAQQAPIAPPTSMFAPAAQAAPAAQTPPVNALPPAPAVIAPAPPSPALAAVAKAPEVFPALPPSTPCAQKDIVALWRLVRVFEEPVGTEKASFAREQNQYIGFYKDNIIGRYSNRNDMKLPDVNKRMREPALHNRNYEQFNIKSGFIYYYKNRVSVESQACFIVQNTIDPFRKGDMLLMPPQQQAMGRRLVKVYKRVGNADIPYADTPAATPPATPAAPATPPSAKPGPSTARRQTPPPSAPQAPGAAPVTKPPSTPPTQ